MDIKNYLKIKNIKISELSKITQIPYTTINEIVNKKVDIDRVYTGTSIKLAHACGLEFNQFYKMCKEGIETDELQDSEILIRNKKYYLKYNINGHKGLNCLFKANKENVSSVKEIAENEIRSIKKQFDNKTNVQTVYHVMFKDISVADVFHDGNVVTKINKYVNDSPKQPFWGDLDKMSPQALTQRFYVFIKDRCYEDSRRDLPFILKQAGLKSNNPYEWIKISHGVNYEDFFWIKINHEQVSWNDVKVR